jgi:hypothetical protein
MVHMTTCSERFNWWLPLYAAAGTSVVFLLIITTGDFGMQGLTYDWVVIPCVTIALILTAVVFAIRHRRLKCISTLSILIVFLVVSWALSGNSLYVRTQCRWFLWSKGYKTNVLAQSSKANGELRHVELDGWGFPGAGNTVQYLVFDPSDSLLATASNHPRGELSLKGVPCEVYRVRRLQSR